MSKAKDKPGLIDKSFKVPLDVILELEELSSASLFGSNRRAIQVGTELLVRMRRKPKVRESEMPAVSQIYSITPRTLDLIDQLLPCYGKRATVLRAVVQVLQEQI